MELSTDFGQAPTQEIRHPGLDNAGVRLFIRREDLLYPALSGNKFRKLKYNLEAMRNQGFRNLYTFGGAYSNHIHAVAAAGRQFGFRSIGFIRGDELAGRGLNPTLRDARENGMELLFLSRRDYAKRSNPAFCDEILQQYGPGFWLPEGGTNEAAVRGCSEILAPGDAGYDFICCAVGTGGTLAGLSLAAGPGQKVRGYAALNASLLPDWLQKLATETNSEPPSADSQQQTENGQLEAGDRQLLTGNCQLTTAYTFGGYARITAELVRFINGFYSDHRVPLDPVYTGKMLYGILADCRSEAFPRGSCILAVHTGGLQGIRGMNERLRKKNLPLLRVWQGN